MQLTCGRPVIARYSSLSLAYTTAKQRGNGVSRLSALTVALPSLSASLSLLPIPIPIAVMEAQLTWRHDRLAGKNAEHTCCVSRRFTTPASLDQRVALLLLPHLLSTRSARRVGRQDIYERAIFESRRAVYAILWF